MLTGDCLDHPQPHNCATTYHTKLGKAPWKCHQKGCSLGHHVATTSNKETDTSIISAVSYKEKTTTVRDCHSGCTYLVDCCADISIFSSTTTEKSCPQNTFVAHYRELCPFIICSNNRLLWLLGYHNIYCTIMTMHHHDCIHQLQFVVWPLTVTLMTKYLLTTMVLPTYFLPSTITVLNDNLPFDQNDWMTATTWLLLWSINSTYGADASVVVQ